MTNRTCELAWVFILALACGMLLSTAYGRWVQ